ncbi:MAG: hypothetical protein N3F63_02545 [Thermoplasmata archaeon]|nr:hypothetical protein [Thermoplasmata archaeon]
MNLSELVMTLKEKRKWEEATMELSRKLEEVERQIEIVSANLRNLEAELSKMKEMLHAEPVGKVEISPIRIREEVK